MHRGNHRYHSTKFRIIIFRLNMLNSNWVEPKQSIPINPFSVLSTWQRRRYGKSFQPEPIRSITSRMGTCAPDLIYSKSHPLICFRSGRCSQCLTDATFASIVIAWLDIWCFFSVKNLLKSVPGEDENSPALMVTVHHHSWLTSNSNGRILGLLY